MPLANPPKAKRKSTKPSASRAAGRKSELCGSDQGDPGSIRRPIPKITRLNLRLGWLYYLSGNYGNSSQYYYGPTDAPGLSKPGSAICCRSWPRRDTRTPSLSPDRYRRAIPENYYANLRLAVALRLQGKYAEAEQVVKPMLKAYPADIYFLSEMAMLNVAQNKKDAARELFSDVLVARPGKCRRQTATPPTVTRRRIRCSTYLKRPRRHRPAQSGTVIRAFTVFWRAERNASARSVSGPAASRTAEQLAA